VGELRHFALQAFGELELEKKQEKDDSRLDRNQDEEEKKGRRQSGGLASTSKTNEKLSMERSLSPSKSKKGKVLEKLASVVKVRFSFFSVPVSPFLSGAVLTLAHLLLH
jgi:hypothetical protein